MPWVSDRIRVFDLIAFWQAEPRLGHIDVLKGLSVDGRVVQFSGFDVLVNFTVVLIINNDGPFAGAELVVKLIHQASGSMK